MEREQRIAVWVGVVKSEVRMVKWLSEVNSPDPTTNHTSSLMDTVSAS